MAIRIDVQVTGTLNLKKELDDFSGSIQRRIIRPALEKVGAYFVGVIQENIHPAHDTDGVLKGSIGYSRPTVSVRAQQGRILIGPRMMGSAHHDLNSATTDPGIYALWVEYGLKNPREAGKRSGKKDKKAGQVPNFTPQPFMRPAFDQGAETAIEVFRDAVNEGIESRQK